MRDLLSGDDVDTPAVPGRPWALLREEVTVDVALRDEQRGGAGALLAQELAEARVSGDGGGVEREGSAQGQEGAERERRAEQLHGDGDETGAWPVNAV